MSFGGASFGGAPFGGWLESFTPSTTLGIAYEIEFEAGVWTDVTSLVYVGSVEIRVGRDSPASGIQPGTLDLDLDNTDGRFTPDNPTSVHYPDFVEGKRIRVVVTLGASTYPRFVGRIVTLEPTYPSDDPAQSVTHVAAVDSLGDLARITLPSYLEAKARAQVATAVAFFPLTDPDEHVGMFDVLDFAEPLRIYDRIPGTGRIDASADDTLGDGQSYVQLFTGKGLWHRSVGLPSLLAVAGGPLYVQACVKVSSSSYGEVLAIGNRRRDNIDQLVRVRWTSTGFIVDSYDGGVSTGSSAAVAADDGWHYLVVKADSSGDSLVVDGGTTATSGGSFTGTPRYLSVGGDMDLTIGQMSVAIFALVGPISGNATSAVISGYDFTLTEYKAALEDAANVSDIQATLSWSSAPTPKATPAFFVGQDGLTALIDLVNSRSGIAYAVPSTFNTQTVQLVDTADFRPTTPALTIDAEGDLSASPTMLREIVERVAVSKASSPLQSVTVVDDTVTGVGAATAEVDTVLADKNDLRAVATDRIARGASARLRPSSLTIDLATTANDLYAAFFALTPGDRIRLSGLPSTYFGFSYIDGYVEGWTERPNDNGYEVTFDLSPADAPPEALADDATYGRATFGDGVCTLTSDITSSATSLSLTFTGSALLSTAAGDYPLDLDVNGERVTIASAPAGGSSPRTLTVTRGVAPTVARAHSAGEPVDVWLGARAAL